MANLLLPLKQTSHKTQKERLISRLKSLLFKNLLYIKSKINDC